MLKILDLLFGIITISIILFSANLLSISVYAQDNHYYYNTDENNNSSLLHEIKNIKAMLENKVTKTCYSSANCQ